MPEREKPSADAPQPIRKPEASVERQEGTDAVLFRAVELLVAALDVCAGDPEDCPNCGPARALALQVLESRPQAEEPTGAERQQRVNLSGRMGADPTFRTSPKGTLIGRFPLAVHPAEGATMWHTVLAFNKRAEALRDVFHKGDAVNVVGYVHERTAKTGTGQNRQIAEIYAVTVAQARRN